MFFFLAWGVGGWDGGLLWVERDVRGRGVDIVGEVWM